MEWEAWVSHLPEFWLKSPNRSAELARSALQARNASAPSPFQETYWRTRLQVVRDFMDFLGRCRESVGRCLDCAVIGLAEPLEHLLVRHALEEVAATATVERHQIAPPLLPPVPVLPLVLSAPSAGGWPSGG